MDSKRSPLITEGQVYLNTDLNEYMVVTHVNRSQVSYMGRGFRGQADSFAFIEQFQPVNPTDLSSVEIDALFEFVPNLDELKIGYLEEA